MRTTAALAIFVKRAVSSIRPEEVSFKQWTDRGYVFCTVKLRVGVCDHCDSRDWNTETEAVILEVVRRERDKLK
jgi:hypothetical protein